MSEKRFKVDYEVGVLDTLTNEIICDTVNANEVVDLLNNQNRELDNRKQIIKTLTQEYKELEVAHNESIKELKEKIVEQQATIQSLKEENEQLRQKANALQTSLNYWQNSYREILEKIPPKIREIWID